MKKYKYLIVYSLLDKNNNVRWSNRTTEFEVKPTIKDIYELVKRETVKDGGNMGVLINFKLLTSKEVNV